MKTYENSYFRLRLDLPETWELTSWRHAEIAHEWQSMYQSSDDDLPRDDNCASKFLFTAALHPPESEALVDADIELSVFRLALGEDMRTSCVENFERLRTYYESNGCKVSSSEAGIWVIGGTEFTFLDNESKFRDRHSWFRVFFRLHHETFWLYGKTAGHKRHAYEEAIGIVEGLKFTAESIG